MTSTATWYGQCRPSSDDLLLHVRQSTFDMAYDADSAGPRPTTASAYYGELSDGILLWSDFTATGDLAFLAGIHAARSSISRRISLDPASLRRGVRLPRTANSECCVSLYASFTPADRRNAHLHHRRNRQPTGPRHQVIPSDKNTSYITFPSTSATPTATIFATPRQYPPYDLWLAELKRTDDRGRLLLRATATS